MSASKNYWKRTLVTIAIAVASGICAVGYRALAENEKQTVRLNSHDRRIEECNTNYNRLISKIDAVDGKLNQIIGYLKGVD